MDRRNKNYISVEPEETLNLPQTCYFVTNLNTISYMFNRQIPYFCIIFFSYIVQKSC